MGGENAIGDDTWEYAQPLDPNATGSPTRGLAPLAVRLSAKPSGGIAPYAYNWSFDDGTPNATTADVARTFYDPGNYTVTLLVENAAGFTAEYQVIIEVEPASSSPTTALSTADLYGIVGAIVLLAVAILVAAVLLSRRKSGPPPTPAWSSAPTAPPARPPSSGS
jgi:PKD repeat protein